MLDYKKLGEKAEALLKSKTKESIENWLKKEEMKNNKNKKRKR